jgi:aminoglycoside phosphotransferase family enzyme/predicted kinase
MRELPGHLLGLLSPDAYPHAVANIELVETHISWVILTGELAYKIKRPVRYDFIDLTRAERREFLCREELRLNQRFAPELYLEVCEVREQDGCLRIGGPGTTIEHAVRMRQFRREDELDRLLAAGRITPTELADFGTSLAGIHGRLPVRSPDTPWGQPETVRRLVLENLEQCERASEKIRASALTGLRQALQARLSSLAQCMRTRAEAGFVRECHGDLHSRNIVRQAARLLAFDCLEYEVAFRWIDVADEIAFLTMDLQAQGHVLHAHAFLNGYLGASGDYEACRVLNLYRAHRALIRAKVMALSAASADATPASSYLEVARGAVAETRPRLVLMSGLSGSGKSFLASRLAPIIGAIHLRSDMERKRLAGLSALARSASPVGGGLYSRERTEAVHERLALAAEHVLAGGYTALVDATFMLRGERARFARLAAGLGADVTVIQCVAPLDVLRRRLEQRRQRGTDPSEADLDVLRWQQAHAEAIAPEEGLRLIEVDTAASDADAQAMTLSSFFTA